jgi:hypothetical protein
MTGRGDISDDDVAALVGLMADAASAFIRGDMRTYAALMRL